MQFAVVWHVHACKNAALTAMLHAGKVYKVAGLTACQQAALRAEGLGTLCRGGVQIAALVWHVHAGMLH